MRRIDQILIRAAGLVNDDTSALEAINLATGRPADAPYEHGDTHASYAAAERFAWLADIDGRSERLDGAIREWCAIRTAEEVAVELREVAAELAG